MDDKQRIAQLEEALWPFALYAQQQAKAWGQHNDCVFYGIKRPGAHQITYGDFRRAASILSRTGKRAESGCTSSNATTRENSVESSREKSSATTQQPSIALSATRPNEWSSMSMMASKLSDLAMLLSGSDNANESLGTNPEALGPSPSDGTKVGKLVESVETITAEQRLQISILAAEFGYRCCERGDTLSMTLKKVMEILGDEDSDNNRRR